MQKKILTEQYHPPNPKIPLFQYLEWFLSNSPLSFVFKILEVAKVIYGEERTNANEELQINILHTA